MFTCQSPRKVLRTAYALGRRFLPSYRSRFSRHDYASPQLFACLVLKEHQKKSYRQAEALLADSPQWRKDIDLDKTPDHSTLCRAAKVLLTATLTQRFLDLVARWAAWARILGLSQKPLVVDATYFEVRHVSHHYLQRRQQQHRRSGYRRRSRRKCAQGVPKLVLASAAACHLVLGLQTATGTSGDQPHLPALLDQVQSRVPHRHLTLAADPGFDSHENHLEAKKRQVRALIPATTGGQAKEPGKVATSVHRRRMQRLLGTSEGRKASGYSQRSQSETVNSMIKRNLDSFTRGRSAWSRRRDMHLKVITHDVMIA